MILENDNQLRDYIKQMKGSFFLTKEDGSIDEDSISTVTFRIIKKLYKGKFDKCYLTFKDLTSALADSFKSDGIIGIIDDDKVIFPDETIRITMLKHGRREFTFFSFGQTLRINRGNADQIQVIPRSVKRVNAILHEMITPELVSEENVRRVKILLQKRAEEEENNRRQEYDTFKKRIDQILQVTKETNAHDLFAKEMTARIKKETLLADTGIDRTKAESYLESAISRMYIEYINDIIHRAQNNISKDLLSNKDPKERRQEFLNSIYPVYNKRSNAITSTPEEIWTSILRSEKISYANFKRTNKPYFEFDRIMAEENTIIDNLVSRGWTLEKRSGTKFRREFAVLFMRIANGQIISFRTMSKNSCDFALKQASILIPAIDKLSKYCDEFSIKQTGTITYDSKREDSLVDNLKKRLNHSKYDLGAKTAMKKDRFLYYKNDGKVFIGRIRKEFTEENAEEISKALRLFAKTDSDFREGHSMCYCSVSFGIKPVNQLLTAKKPIAPTFHR